MKKIGFIGQGWVGKSYADDFENRGFDVVRYSMETPYTANKSKIKNCDIVFIAVPTPTTLSGFDDSIVRSVAKLVGKGRVAVIKSTILPGTTDSVQKENQNIFVMHSPEFLDEVSAAHDAAHPRRNIIGIPEESQKYRKAAQEVLSVLPEAPYSAIIPAKEAEMVKYAGNCLSYVKVVFVNILYDLVQSFGGDWERVKEAISADPRIGGYHMNPVHKGGRGAGGDCFIKDFAALAEIYRKKHPKDKVGLEMLEAIKEKNLDLLVGTGKSLELIAGVYGKEKIKGKQ